MRRLRKAVALAISLLPTNPVRVACYRSLLGYHMGAGSRIGWRTIIAVDAFTCGEQTLIASGNQFAGPFSVQIGRNVVIGKNNLFTAGNAIASASESSKNYARQLLLGDGALVNAEHIFDVIGRIEVGAGTWLAGFRSQFLTHGAGVFDRDIVIGEGCFLGSAVLIAPGSQVGSNCIVAMGALVTKRFADTGVILGGVPAQVLRQRSLEDGHAWERTW